MDESANNVYELVAMMKMGKETTIQQQNHDK